MLILFFKQINLYCIFLRATRSAIKNKRTILKLSHLDGITDYRSYFCGFSFGREADVDNVDRVHFGSIPFSVSLFFHYCLKPLNQHAQHQHVPYRLRPKKLIKMLSWDKNPKCSLNRFLKHLLKNRPSAHSNLKVSAPSVDAFLYLNKSFEHVTHITVQLLW